MTRQSIRGNNSLVWGLDKINSPVVGGAPGYGFHLLPGPFRE